MNEPSLAAELSAVLAPVSMPADVRMRVRREVRNPQHRVGPQWSRTFGAIAAGVAASILFLAAVMARRTETDFYIMARNLKPCGDPAQVERWLGVQLNNRAPIELAAQGESEYQGRNWKILQFRANGKVATLFTAPARSSQPAIELRGEHSRHWTSGDREFLLVAENRQACLLCHENLI